MCTSLCSPLQDVHVYLQVYVYVCEKTAEYGVPVVASVVIQPQALHWTSAQSLDKREMSGCRALACTIVCLFSAEEEGGQIRREGRREREIWRGRREGRKKEEERWKRNAGESERGKR